TFALDKGGHYTNDKTTVIASGNLFVLAILNSSVQDFYFRQVASTKLNAYFEQKYMYVEQIPIPDVPANLREKITATAQRCLDAAKDHPSTLASLEAELNAL